MKKLCAYCLIVLLLAMLALPVQAEENLYDRLLPVLDAAVAAQQGGTGGYLGVRPMAVELSPEGDAAVVLGSLYRAKAQLDTLTPEEYGAVEWLDQRVVATLRLDAGSGAWTVTELELQAELLMEDAAQAYFGQTMRTFISDEYGFSVQYPAVFPELALESGRAQAQLPDGTASILLECTANTAGASLQTLTAQEQARIPQARLTENAPGGTARLAYAAEGMNVADVYAVTEQWIYHVQLTWADSLNADFMLYSEYVMNSLSADEFGMG